MEPSGQAEVVLLNVDATITLGEQPDAHADLARIEQELARMPDRINRALRAGDIGEVTRCRALQAQLPDRIKMAQVAVADADINAAEARIEDITRQFENVRLRGVETGEIVTQTGDAFLSAKREHDGVIAQERGLQNAMVAAHSARDEAMERRERVLNPDPDPDPPAQAQPHRAMTPTTQFPYSSCRRDGSSVAG